MFIIQMAIIKRKNKTVSDEFKWDEKKIVNMVLDDECPSFKANEQFKNKLDSKISEKIKSAKEQKRDTDTMNAIPKKLKWRMYLTWYGYAVCSFIALFLIWFCTNIFTWTIKLPTKYNYLEDAQAFWSVSDLWKALDKNYLSESNVDSDDIFEEENEQVLVETKWIDSSSTLLGASKSKALMNSYSNDITSVESDEEDNLWWYDVFDRFLYNKTYRFSYKSKMFPKLSENYPVYKVDWTLISYSTPKQLFKNLKIWWVSLKNFSDLEMERFEMSETTENWYTIMFDNRTQKLSFYPNNSWKAGDFQWTLPSKKKIIKSVEKELKLLWVSLKDYGDWVVNFDDFDENMWIIQIFYPFKLQWKNVRNAEENKQIGMDIAYDLNLQKIVYVNNIDIAKYQFSDYSTVEKSILEDKIEQWWSYFSQWALHEYSTLVMLDSMEVVYLEKVSESWDIYYVPAIKWTVSTSLENYVWPKIIFQELI